MARAPKEIAADLVNAVKANASLVGRYKCYSVAGFPSEDLRAWKNAVAQTKGADTESNIQTKLTTGEGYFTKATTIDPFNRFQIFNDIIWSTISTVTPPGLTLGDGEGNQPTIRSTCRGVRYREVFDIFSGTSVAPVGFTEMFINAFSTDKVSSNWLDENDATKNIKNQQKYLEELTEGAGKAAVIALNTNERKELFSQLFEAEEMAKLFFIENYLLNIQQLASPWGLMGYDPYFAYLIMYTGWLGGAELLQISPQNENAGIPNPNALKDRKTQPQGGTNLVYAIQQALGGSDYSNKENHQFWHDYIGTDDTKRANLATQAIKFLEVTGKWLQQVKQDEKRKAYFDDWNAKFITDNKSMVNMLVIVNELVNGGGTVSKYSFTEKVKGYQLGLDTAYRKFEMEIGD